MRGHSKYDHPAYIKKALTLGGDITEVGIFYGMILSGINKVLKEIGRSPSTTIINNLIVPVAKDALDISIEAINCISQNQRHKHLQQLLFTLDRILNEINIMTKYIPHLPSQI